MNVYIKMDMGYKQVEFLDLQKIVLNHKSNIEAIEHEEFSNMSVFINDTSQEDGLMAIFEALRTKFKHNPIKGNNIEEFYEFNQLFTFLKGILVNSEKESEHFGIIEVKFSENYYLIGQIFDLFIDLFPSYGNKNLSFFEFIIECLSTISNSIDENAIYKHIFLRIIKLIIMILHTAPIEMIETYKNFIMNSPLLILITENIIYEECLQFFEFMFGNPEYTDIVFKILPISLFTSTLLILLHTSENQKYCSCIIFILRKIYKYFSVMNNPDFPELNLPYPDLPRKF